MADRIEEHFRLFNEAVRSHDWAAFLATFTPDAVMRFDGVPVGHNDLRIRCAGW